MRTRPILDKQSAIVAAVDRAARKFDALTDPAAIPAAAAIDPAAAVPIADTYLIASIAHSRPEIVSHADFRTDQIADDVEINAAFAPTLPDGVPGSGSSAHVVLAAGRYESAGTITIVSFGTLKGTGRGSNFDHQSANLQFVLKTGAEIAHLSFIST